MIDLDRDSDATCAFVVVEPNPVFRRDICEALRELGPAWTIAAGATLDEVSGVASLLTNIVAVFVSAVPGEAMRAAIAEHFGVTHARIVVVTGFGTEAEIHAQGWHHLAQPFTTAAVHMLVTTLLAARVRP